MKTRFLSLAAVVYLLAPFSIAGAAEAPAPGETASPPSYMQISIDRVVVDSAGLVAASETLALSIDRLALSIDRISADGAGFTAEERETLLSAAQSVDRASLALSELARQLPLSVQRFTEQIPRVVREARQPIAELSIGLQAASDSLVTITESLPQATENARALVNSSLDSALLRVSIYSIVLIAILALAVIAVMWFTYRQYLDPLAKKLDALVGAPEHFASMSEHMRDTSNNLLTLKRTGPRSARPSRQSLSRRE